MGILRFPQFAGDAASWVEIILREYHGAAQLLLFAVQLQPELQQRIRIEPGTADRPMLPVQQRVARESIPCGKDRRTRIVKAQLGNRAGLIGAALLGKNKRI